MVSVIGTRRFVPPGPAFGTDLVFAGVALVALRAVAFFIGVTYSHSRTYGGSEVWIPRRDHSRTRAINWVTHVSVPGFIIILRLRIFAPCYGRIGQ